MDPKTSPAPGIGQSLGLVGIFLGFQTALVSVVMIPAILVTRRLEFNLTFIALANGLALVPTLWLAGLICRRPWQELVRFGGLPLHFIPAVLLMGSGGFVLCSEIENLTRHVLPMPDAVSRVFNDMFNVRDNPLGAFLALVLVAPLTEELLVRGWVLAAMLRQWPPARAVVVSALLFGAMHMNPWQFFYATALGLAFGWIYWRTRSLWLCVLAHALNNGAAWGIVFSGVEIPGLSGGGFHEAVRFQSFGMNLGALVLLGLGMGWLRSQTRSLIPPPLPASFTPPP